MNGLINPSWYNSDDYQFDKIIGRRTQTGELKLKRLKGVHRELIGYHLRGLSNRDIAFHTGFSEIAISRILRDPLSLAYINTHFEGTDGELKALGPLAVDAIRTGLQSDSEATKLKAADKFFRATGKYNTTGDVARDTAEDVIARALAVMQKQAGAIENLTKPDPVEKLIDITPMVE